MLGPWPNRGIDHSTAACVWRESDPWFIVYMHNNIYIYTTDYNRIIPHRSGDVPHITGGITHLLSGMRPKVVSAWCPLMIDCHQSPGHMTRFIPWKPALGLGPCKQRLHRGPCWQVPSVFFLALPSMETVKSLTAGGWKTTEPNAPPENSPLCRMSSR